MSSELDALVQAILANPADDLVRGVYADRLDERAEPGDAERAEFIRVQCELARPAEECLTPSLGSSWTSWPNGMPCRECRPRNKKGCLPWCGPCSRRDDLMKREAGLLDTHATAWLPELPPLIKWKSGVQFGWRTEGTPENPHQYFRSVFRRGFVDLVECSSAGWIGHGDAILEHHAITDVSLTSWPDFDCHHNPRLRNFELRLSLPGLLVTDQMREEAVSLAGSYDAVGRLVRDKISGMMARRWPGIRFDLSRATAVNWNHVGRFDNDIMENLQAMIRRMQDEIVRGMGIPPHLVDPPR